MADSTPTIHRGNVHPQSYAASKLANRPPWIISGLGHDGLCGGEILGVNLEALNRPNGALGSEGVKKNFVKLKSCMEVLFCFHASTLLYMALSSFIFAEDLIFHRLPRLPRLAGRFGGWASTGAA